MKKKLVFIGTSGWSYTGWTGNFYPKDLKSRDFLKFYSEHYKTVEVNSSFYHRLKDTTVIHWNETVPSDFVFAVKADRYITHNKKLENPEETIPVFMESLKSFKDKLGPVLFQLPPSFGFNLERLKSFVNVLPKDFLYVFEFRNKTWFNDETYDILYKNKIALCIYNLKGYQSPNIATADFVYFRYHGTNGIGSGRYSKEDIENLSQNIKKFAASDKKVFCYFNNDSNGAALLNADELISVLK